MRERVPYNGTDFCCDVAIPRLERLTVVHDDARVLAFHHTRPSGQSTSSWSPGGTLRR